MLFLCQLLWLIGLGIPPLQLDIMRESNPLKSRTRRLAERSRAEASRKRSRKQPSHERRTTYQKCTGKGIGRQGVSKNLARGRAERKGGPQGRNQPCRHFLPTDSSETKILRVECMCIYIYIYIYIYRERERDAT